MHSPPALAYFTERHARDFAAAARCSKKFHAGLVSPPTDTSSAAALAERRQGPSDFGYVIHEMYSAEVAGYIEITSIVRGPFQSGYLGYYMFAGFNGRGYMKWALGEIVRRAWRDLKLHRLEANIQPQNEASIALVRSLGFTKEGFSRAYLKVGGRWRDHERWAILAR